MSQRSFLSRAIEKLRELRGLRAMLQTTKGELERELRQTQQLLDDFKSSFDVPSELTDEFHRWKVAHPIPATPLVSVCVPTYNRPELLLNRCLPSILNQTYSNLEVIVVGDCAMEETVRAMERIHDPRLVFVNLPERANYPRLPELTWCVSGVPASNKALTLATGDFIAHLDDDDEYLPTRIATLVDFAIARQLDVVWHPFWNVHSDGRQGLTNADVFAYGQVNNGSIFYRAFFCRIAFDFQCYALREVNDWNRYRKFRYLRPRMERYSEPLYRHYGR